MNKSYVFKVGIFLLALISAITYYYWSAQFQNMPMATRTSQHAKLNLSRCSGLIDDFRKDENVTFIKELCQKYANAVPVNISDYELAEKQLSKLRISNDHYIKLAQDCDCFRAKLGYLTLDNVTNEEREFPIAFSILLYEELGDTERLLRLIYRPHNVYCINVDGKDRPDVHLVVKSISRCFDNVIVLTPPITVGWGHISIVDAEISCMKRMLELNKKWKYFINLVGRDFTLRTNLELVKILKTYNGANDIDGRYVRKVGFDEWAAYEWDQDPKIPNSRPRWTGRRANLSAPYNVSLSKGLAHLTAVRAFVEFVVNDPRAHDLRNRYAKAKLPEEQYFNTLNNSPHLKIPGSFKGDPDKKRGLSRLKEFIQDKINATCDGGWIRTLCIFGVGDLPRVIASKRLFANKLRTDRDPVAYRCMELHYHNHVINPDKNFNVTYYATQPFSLNHV